MTFVVVNSCYEYWLISQEIKCSALPVIVAGQIIIRTIIITGIITGIVCFTKNYFCASTRNQTAHGAAHQQKDCTPWIDQFYKFLPLFILMVNAFRYLRHTAPIEWLMFINQGQCLKPFDTLTTVLHNLT